MEVGISILGSGSSGNSIVLHSGNEALMIDAGFSRAETLKRLSCLGISPSIVKALVLSHEHGDHCKGARVFADSLDMQVFATSQTAKELMRKNLLPGRISLFEAGSDFEAAGFRVRTFHVPHDAIETVGFVVSRGDVSVGIATDLGYMTALCEQRLRGCSAIILEANHDVRMQMNSDRNPNLIRRVLGRNGHLSNDSAAEALERILTERTRALILVHLSRDCNDYEIVEKTARRKLADMKREDILLEIATDAPLPTVHV